MNDSEMAQELRGCYGQPPSKSPPIAMGGDFNCQLRGDVMRDCRRSPSPMRWGRGVGLVR